MMALLEIARSMLIGIIEALTPGLPLSTGQTPLWAAAAAMAAVRANSSHSRFRASGLLHGQVRFLRRCGDAEVELSVNGRTTGRSER